jgi:pyridoxamine 5'-phosphate oxidase
VRRVSSTELLVSANATSPKVRALCAQPRAELLLYWPTLQRQYRLSGPMAFVSASREPALYRLSPWRSKVWDQLYEHTPQSTVVAGREHFVDRFRATLERLQRDFSSPSEVPPTDSAGYLALQPDRIEIQVLDLQERLHDRRRFERTAEGWRQHHLMP